MRSVDVRTLKARASELLHAVEEGETVLVTRRGRPVARLERVTEEPQQGMRLRGLLSSARDEVEAFDAVAEIRNMRKQSTARLRADLEPRDAPD